MAAASAAFAKVFAALFALRLIPRGPWSLEVRRRQREVRARDLGVGVGGATASYPLDEQNDDIGMRSPSAYDIKSTLAQAGTKLDTARTELQQMLDTKHGGPVWEAGGGTHSGKRRWVDDAKMVLRAVVEMRIVVVRRLVELWGDGVNDKGDAGKGIHGDWDEISKRVKVVLPEPKGGAWGCWIVPKLVDAT